MNIVTDIKEWQVIRSGITETIGFVPTMGNLHEGHFTLVRRSLDENSVTVVSIFVNPTQFNESEDFKHYPRTWDEDASQLKKLGVDYLLFFKKEDLYPHDYQMKVMETELSSWGEGACRPGHFEGMLTIVLKLLNLSAASNAYFGEKDFQQYLLVKKMVEAFFIPTKIIPCQTVREKDGLAMSSRNSRLAPNARQKAADFFRILSQSKSAESASEALKNTGFDVEYVIDAYGRRLAAVECGGVRLIDNVEKEIC